MVCVTGTLEPRPTGQMRLILEGHFEIKETPGPGLCFVKGCRHLIKPCHPALGLCHKHYQARWRRQNPKQAAFATLRMHARKRRIDFTLSFQRFVEITDATGFWTQNAASHGDKLSVDRIDMAGAYSDDNVRIITVSENVILGNRHRHLSPVVQAILARRQAQPAWQMSGATEDGWLGEPDPF